MFACYSSPSLSFPLRAPGHYCEDCKDGAQPFPGKDLERLRRPVVVGWFN